MNKIDKQPYDLEERTLIFAQDCRSLINKIPKNTTNIEDSKQLARSSGSIAANYIEANECVSKKDFVFRIKIARKESKESILWLRLFVLDDQGLEAERLRLIQEATELMKILSSIMRKSE